MKVTVSADKPATRPSAKAPERLMRHAGFLIHKAGQRGLHVVNASLAGLGIDVKHYGILSVLLEGPCSQVALSEALRVDRTSMVQLVDELEAMEMVQRTVNPEDRRAHLLKVTRRGRKLVESGDRFTKEADEMFLAPLAEEERTQLRALLLKLL